MIDALSISARAVPRVHQAAQCRNALGRHGDPALLLRLRRADAAEGARRGSGADVARRGAQGARLAGSRWGLARSDMELERGHAQQGSCDLELTPTCCDMMSYN